MKIDYSGLLLDSFTCNKKTKESAFRKHFDSSRQVSASKEHSYPFRITERDAGLSFSGTAVFARGRLTHMTLYALNGAAGRDLYGFVASMLGKASVRGDGTFAYTYSMMELLILRDALTDCPYLEITFYQVKRRPLFHFDNPIALRRLYRYCGVRRYFRLLVLVGWMSFFFILSGSKEAQAQRIAAEGTHTYEEGFRLAFSGEEAYYEEGLQRAIERDLRAAPLEIEQCCSDARDYRCAAVVFLALALHGIAGLYHLERASVGRSVRKFTDGRDRRQYLDTLARIDGELAHPDYRDYYITVTPGWVAVRDYPLYQARFFPRGAVTAVRDGTIRYRNKYHTIRRPCLDIHTPDGRLHKYANSAANMERVKEMLSEGTRA